MSLFKSRSKRAVRRLDPSENLRTGSYFSGTERGEPLQPRKRRWPKRLFIAFLMLALLAAIGLAGAYVYFDSTVLKGERGGRINILVIGVDDAASLSDTLMVVSIDTRHGKEPQAALISIPRDLYLDIPEFGEGKINVAYTFGQNNDYPGGGPALSARTVSEILDQPIHYFVAMDFSGFKEAVDAIGGVDLEVKQAIDDPLYPDAQSGYEAFTLPAGKQHLDGETALKYARSRQTTTDFDRAARQQQILVAFRHQLVNQKVLFDRQRTRRLQEAVDKHLKTDLSQREVAKLGLIWREIDDGRTTRHVIDGTNFLEPYFNGSYTPRAGFGDFSEIHEFVKNIFEQNSNNLPEAQQ